MVKNKYGFDIEKKAKSIILPVPYTSFISWREKINFENEILAKSTPSTHPGVISLNHFAKKDYTPQKSHQIRIQ